MRLALISDIHGNLTALQATLKAIEQLEVDQTICLGDVASMGAQPHETVRLLASRDIPVVMGNTDAEILHPPTHEDNPKGLIAQFIDINAWGADQLTSDDRQYIQSFKPTLTVSLGKVGEMLCFHGSPQSYDDIIRDTTPIDQLKTYFGDTPARVLAGGHTHDQLLRRYQSAWLINVGSVGIPHEILAGNKVINPPRAEFALIEADDMKINVSFHHVYYDVTSMLDALRNGGMPHLEWFMQGWLG